MATTAKIPIAHDVQVPFKLSFVKPNHAKWLLGLYNHLRNTPSSKSLQWLESKSIGNGTAVKIYLC